jgi:hypothetical protein
VIYKYCKTQKVTSITIKFRKNTNKILIKFLENFFYFVCYQLRICLKMLRIFFDQFFVLKHFFAIISLNQFLKTQNNVEKSQPFNIQSDIFMF